ncbi:hypothetical protein [Ferriphaselus sp. R-1]|uniref:hypothetical protein n=1 Tax=Ferriphaselus sp. R-1 TaxID=1485544 RepID=UPI001267AC40|nr:hypothetical protein [Ferriphaselus sp. R-1]
MMKLGFWLLLASNLVLFAITQLGAASPEIDPQVRPEYHPELVRLPRAATVEPPAPASDTAVPVAKCQDWGEFSGTELARAEKLLAASMPSERWSKHFIERAHGFWVFIPPLSSPTMLLKRSAELKMSGINDFYPVKEVGPLQGAISLGAFKQREGGEKLLARLQAKGISDAKLEPYLTRNTYAAFTVRELTEAESSKLKARFPASQLQSVTCPAPTESPKP